MSAARRIGWRTGMAVLALAACGVLGADVAWRQLRWNASLAGARFVDHEEKISGRAAAVSVTGYLVVAVASDVDFFELARADGAHPKVRATLCDSGKPLGAWADPLPRDERAPDSAFVYSVLVPARSTKADLAATSEDVCLRFEARSGSPLSWISSRAVVVPLRGTLREQLADYARRDGAVQLVLDPACLPLLCQPDFTPGDLRR